MAEKLKCAAFLTGMRTLESVVLRLGGCSPQRPVGMTQRTDMWPACAQTSLDVTNVPMKLGRPDFGVAARAPASGLCSSS